jgi:hypothetical protein
VPATVAPIGIAVEGADRVVSITAAQTRKHSRAAAAAKRIEELDN